MTHLDKSRVGNGWVEVIGKRGCVQRGGRSFVCLSEPSLCRLSRSWERGSGSFYLLGGLVSFLLV